MSGLMDFHGEDEERDFDSWHGIEGENVAGGGDEEGDDSGLGKMAGYLFMRIFLVRWISRAFFPAIA